MIRVKRTLSKPEVAHFYDILKFLAVLGLSLEYCDIYSLESRMPSDLLETLMLASVVRHFTDLPLPKKVFDTHCASMHIFQRDQTD